MNLTFGMFLDGAQWSEKEATLGEVRLGPFGMLAFLEARLGLSMPAVHSARRVDEYLDRMKTCHKQASGRSDLWHHKSFEVDPWSTARQMLAWRDQLTAGGWKSNSFAGTVASPRLRALAALEQIDIPLSEGFEDRLQGVWDCLRRAESIPIEIVCLLDQRELLPPIWQKIIGRVEELGAALIDASTIGEGVSSPASLSLVEAEDEWQAAETLALWLASAPADKEDVVIICGADTDILDQALKRHGLPQLGVSSVSRWRALSQILPLALANLWYPLDVRRLVELLSIPMSPIPGFASRRLLKALAEEPGVGGKAWKDALASITEERVARVMKNTPIVSSDEARKEAGKFTEELDILLSRERCSPDEGVPEVVLKQRCQWVIERLANQTGDGVDSMLAEAVGQARELQTLANGKDMLPRILVDRMLDSVIGAGISNSNPVRAREAASWTVVSHPGQICTPVEAVVWWGFVEPPSPPSNYWSRTERDVLESAGVELELEVAPRRREAAAWRRALRFAQKRFLMFHFKRKDGQELPLHPFWDEICGASDSPPPSLHCDELCADGNWRLADRAATLQKAKREHAAPVDSKHTIPPNLAAPQRLSYSQMSTLIGCPMKWTLQYHSGLRTPDTLALPSGNRMIGSLCHRIVHDIYSEADRDIGPDEAAVRTGQLYDELLPSMASELMLPGKELENKRAKRAAVYAVRQLVETIGRLGLRVEKSEGKLEARMGDVSFEGYVDLILRDRAGGAFVLDMKWTKSSRYKKEEIEEGRAVQLAVYAWLLRSLEPKDPVHAGYFMLAQGELFSDSSLLKENALPSERSLEEIWTLSAKEWDEALKMLNEGVVEAKGVAEILRQDEDQQQTEKKEGLVNAPLCSLCDFAVLCGLNEVLKEASGG
jgi:RecB family exonuclease